MTSSIRRRALIIILPMVASIWLISAYVSYYQTQEHISQFLDTQLAQNAKVLLAMSMHELVEQEVLSESNHTSTSIANHLFWNASSYKNEIAFQVWLNDTKLTLQSDNAPNSPMSTRRNGFENITIQNRLWRVYSASTKTSTINVQVAIQISVQDGITKSMIERVIFPLLVMLPLLGFFVWTGINNALYPIKQMTRDLGQRKKTDLSPISEKKVPKEARSVIIAINQLFSQLKLAFDTEKRFTSDAAHELRTPLAALKTHAEVALQAKEIDQQQKALRHVIQGVNRATRLVEQLLTLARLDPESGFTEIRRFDLFIAAETVLSNEAHLAIAKDIEISLGGTRGKFVAGNYDAICVLMRNLVDNAIRYTPTGGEVEVSIDRKKDKITLTFSDSGPGIPIPEEERTKIFSRFYRSLGTKESGSGLGLSIVTRIAELHHLNISLHTSKLGGLRIDIDFVAKDFESISESTI